MNTTAEQDGAARSTSRAASLRITIDKLNEVVCAVSHDRHLTR
jgi:hypothetical protein